MTFLTFNLRMRVLCLSLLLSCWMQRVLLKNFLKFRNVFSLKQKCKFYPLSLKFVSTVGTWALQRIIWPLRPIDPIFQEDTEKLRLAGNVLLWKNPVKFESRGKSSLPSTHNWTIESKRVQNLLLIWKPKLILCMFVISVGMLLIEILSSNTWKWGRGRAESSNVAVPCISMS